MNQDDDFDTDDEACQYFVNRCIDDLEEAINKY